MRESIIRAQLDATVQETNYYGIGERYQGKVRDTYADADRLILITTDRISAFDRVLRQTIPFKGQVLNGVAAYFFDQTVDIVQNHILDIPDPNVTFARRCTSIPIEFVVRGYLAGHAWRMYRDGSRLLCGKVLPEGLWQNSRLPEPILTPATKAVEGHDEDITRTNILELGLMDAPLFDRLESVALSLFERGTEKAAERGLILVDTKYEFGLDFQGEVTLIDEIHTPDSSRYFYSDTFEALLLKNEPQHQLSKEFVREWLIDKGFQGHDGQVLPDLDEDFRIEVSRRYIELFERITGNTFVPETSQDPLTRIASVLSNLRIA